MWRIIATDKITGRIVEVAVADNPAEKEIILRQEARNYDDLRAIPLRMTYRAFHAAEVGA
jgi:hypothetical protein